MCLAVPLEIKEIKGSKAIVGNKNHSHEIDINLIKNPKIGDYILVHGELAINKLPKEEAEKILNLMHTTSNAGIIRAD